MLRHVLPRASIHAVFQGMTKKKIVAYVLAAIAAIGVIASFLMILPGDPYSGLFGYAIGAYSGIVGAIALLFWVWGRPLAQAIPIFIGGTIAGAALIFGGMHGLFSMADERRAAKNARQLTESAKAYLEAKGYRFERVKYDPQKNKLVTEPSAVEGPSSQSVLVMPVGGELLLIVDGRDSYGFDGVSSERVNYHGADPEGMYLAAGSFTFRGKIYSIDAMTNADLEYGRDAGGDPPYLNPKLVDAIAPAPRPQ
jgi:hypothetical protein